MAKKETFNVIAVPLKGKPYVYIRMKRIESAQNVAKEFLGPKAYVLPYSQTPPEILNQRRPVK